ncbi:MAG: NUDIX hydrolase [Gammaproteobacteria bacterium]|nr:NUDIX hydrolase [Gammaproteobacteria bacterium]
MHTQWKPAVTVAAIVERDGRFLIVEEHTSRGRALNQPAGHLEFAESLTAAVCRETHEETGWTIEPTACIGVYQWWREHRNVTVVRFAFAATAVDHDDTTELDEGIITTHWLTLPELREHDLPLRSPMVLRCIEDYEDGRRFPLDMIQRIVPDTVKGGQQ